MSEEVRVFDPDIVTIRIESGSRDEVMDVGMEEQSLVPGVKHPGEPVRGCPEDTGRGEAALAYYEKHFKVYPLGAGVHQPGAVSASFKGGDTTHPRDIRCFELLNKMVQYEPLTAFTPEELGLLKALGIEKGTNFQPDERMRRILSDGVRLGDGMAKAIMFASRDPAARVYPDRHWERVFIGGARDPRAHGRGGVYLHNLSLIHISEPTRPY